MERVCESLGLSATTDQQAALLSYLELLGRWNQTHNLTAIRRPAEMLTQHLADCLAAVAALGRHACGATARRILDVGSGGGLPGLLLAMFRPASTVVCIDAVAKKAAFIRQAAGQLRLENAEARHGRVEALPGPPFDLITARALATLAQFVQMTRHLLAEGGCWMAMKGQAPGEEILQLPPEVEAFHVERLSVPGLDAQRCLVWMRLRRDT
ncbi:MAG: 16S rRNA (guanine(527)-N(7))-methyltransferase RsmG [Rubrivivax sp.]|nr:16S rRNA (guanine(527)-N(7))-methyltransferase RsmG [Rubrivivax sp.]